MTKVWVALPCGRNLSTVDIAKCDPKFSGWKKTLKIRKNIRSAVVLVWGRLELNNIRNQSSNSQRLSVLSVKRDQFETRSIRNKRGRIFRPFALSWTDEGTTIFRHFKAFTHPFPPPGLACVMQDLKL